ncbi:MAG: hypothetical protein L3J58_11660 [Emcibacter sp.]|nr:hypothetical protein [Emcibacter sp.]
MHGDLPTPYFMLMSADDGSDGDGGGGGETDADGDTGGSNEDDKDGDDKVDTNDPLSKLAKAAKDDKGDDKDGDKPGAYDHIPEHLRGKDGVETANKLLEAYKGLRKGGEKAPEKAEDYTLDVATNLDGFLDPASDEDKPILDAFRAVAHEHGLSNNQFGNIINGFYGKLIETGAIEKPLDMNAQVEILGGKEQAARLIGVNAAWGDGLVTSGALTKEEGAEFKIMAGSGMGLRVMNKLREMTGDRTAPAKFPAGEGGPDAASLQERLHDKRNETDQAFATETAAMYKKAYPGNS